MRTLLTVNGQTPATRVEDITRCFNEKHELGFWLDIEAPDDADYELLEKTFKFHALTIEDIRHQNQRPKVDEYEEYNFSVLFVADLAGDELVLREHHLFVGAHYLITVHQEPSPELKELQERVHKSPELSHGKPGFLTYLAIDTMVDASFPVLDKLDDIVDALEDDITTKATRQSLARIYNLKHTVSELRRHFFFTLISPLMCALIAKPRRCSGNCSARSPLPTGCCGEPPTRDTMLTAAKDAKVGAAAWATKPPPNRIPPAASSLRREIIWVSFA